MTPKAWNWRLWTGFACSLLALFGYFLLFEITRTAFWISLLLCIVAVILLIGGLRRAYSAPEAYRGKIAGPILATLSLLVIALFGFGLYMMKRAYPVAQNAPHVGQKAPEFLLTDSNGGAVKLAELLSAPLPGTSAGAAAPRGVLLVFYRGYW
ncbi:MAG: hypothetical protein DMG60_07660 [Acidobacteria bacterium]|nr:MAG: hypothetical protein DMG60_07660 [Acidobacteriota bacterium]